ncbi:MAG TPA: hypothetical protein VM597_38690 [Gemmataceae bacterium]|nr:hypothetical protein [Gemmataceae bacterium]
MEASATAASDRDRECLAALGRKQQLIRDLVRGVVHGHFHGLYLYGRSGVGKSYSVVHELEALEAHFKLLNSHLTGRGLYDVLQRFPDAVILVEDAEEVLRDKAAVGLLRSCLWAQPARGGGHRERWVGWSTHRRQTGFYFTGSVVMTANVPIDDLPQLAAVKSRICHHQFEVSDAEVRAS